MGANTHFLLHRGENQLHWFISVDNGSGIRILYRNVMSEKMPLPRQRGWIKYNLTNTFGYNGLEVRILANGDNA